jgi:DNA-binding LacI/PurR family transcriptional regulator
MSDPLRRLPLAEQTAAHLREGFQTGRWVGLLPGVPQLANELLVSNQTVRTALKLLEAEGWLEDRGAGRRRRIVAEQVKKPDRRTLRIGIMLHVPLEKNDAMSLKVLLGTRRAIEMAGHTCVFSDQYLTQMGDKAARLSRAVKAADVDAWIVSLGSSVAMEWFAAQPLPVFALGGRFEEFPVAGSATRIAPAIESAVDALVKLGHRRIVMLTTTLLRQPKPIPSLASYLTFLEARGIATADYHLPHFEDTAEGLEHCLDSLFRVTPPTALMVVQSDHCAAVLAFLARRRLQVPGDVSLIYMDNDPVFALRLPPLDHFRGPVKEYIARVARWVDGVAKGRPDKRQVIFPAVYVPGGTVGPAKK